MVYYTVLRMSESVDEATLKFYGADAKRHCERNRLRSDSFVPKVEEQLGAQYFVPKGQEDSAQEPVGFEAELNGSKLV
jgi:hypothetical protein